MKPISSIIQIDETIASISGYCLSSKYGDNKTFGQPLGVKTVGFVEIISTSGKIGYGEIYAAVYLPEIVAEITKSLAKYFIGKKIGDLTLSENILLIPFIGRNGLLQSFSSAIDAAIWDLRGKILNLPVYKLFQDYVSSKEVYISGGSVILSPDEIEKDIDNLLSKNKFSIYKMRIGYQEWSNDLKRIEKAYSVLSKGCLIIDAIMGTIRPPWTENEALKNLKELENFSIKWIEEPLFPGDLIALKNLNNLLSIPIAAGEAYSGSTEIEQLINSKSINFLQLDGTHTGSFKLCHELSNQAVKNDINPVTHVWGTNLALLINTHMACANNNISLIEVPSINLELNQYLYPEGIQIKDGFINLKDAPGFGVTLDNDIKNKFKFVPNSGYVLPSNRKFK